VERGLEMAEQRKGERSSSISGMAVLKNPHVLLNIWFGKSMKNSFTEEDRLQCLLVAPADLANIWCVYIM
jgi:hypothetical protein